MILRGNHKSSHPEMNSSALVKSISKDIDHGWELPLTIKYLPNIKNAGVLPLGVEEQFPINEKGGRYMKRRMTPNCSFPGQSGLSTNSRVQHESPQPCFYEFFLLRIIQMISVMKSKWPTKRILIGKIDLDLAYRQIHANVTTT